MSFELHDHLLKLVKVNHVEGINEFLTTTYPELPPEEQAIYTGRESLDSPTSKPAQLLIGASRFDAPGIFEAIWEAFYLQHSSSEPQIPYECLHQAARVGSLPLARLFTRWEPLALARAPPPVPHGRPGAGQIATALRFGRFDYVDFILSQGISIDHEWPRVKILRLAVAWEQTDEELLSKVKWLVDRGARVSGAGALRRLAAYGATDAAEVLLDAGAHVEDLEDDCPDAGPAPLERVESALMEAVKAGHVDMVRLLVARGADSSLKNAEGISPKILARNLNQEDIIQVLEGNSRP